MKKRKKKQRLQALIALIAQTFLNPSLYFQRRLVQHVDGKHHQLYLYSLTLLLSQSKSIADGAPAVHLRLD